MIDISVENLIPLTAATQYVPPWRSNKKAHFTTLLRWVLKGVKSPSGEMVRLEAVRCGGRWLTSRDALQRFISRLTPRLETGPAATSRPPRERRKASERAAEQLEKLGI